MRGGKRVAKCVDKDNIIIVIILIFVTFIYASLFETTVENTVITCTREEKIIDDRSIIQKAPNTLLQTMTEKSDMVFTKTSKIKGKYQKKKIIKTKTPRVKLLNFNYPLNIDMVKLVKDVKEHKTVFYKPINVYKYKLVKNCESVCGLKMEDTSKLLLFAIKSAAKNFNEREIIRETWGKEIRIDEFIIKRVFIIGLSNSVVAEKNISTEYKKYGDIIQYNFDDRYYNNTVKTIGTINWITTYCKQVSFVLFVDDDYFVSPQNLVTTLRNLTNTQIRKLYMGHVWYVPAPMRNPKRKWYVSHSEYPFNRYPSFINAGSYVMSMHTVVDMQVAIQYTQFFRLDDVYLGIVAYKLHIEPLNNKEFRIMQINITRKAIETVIASHGFRNSVGLTKAWEIHLQIIKSRSK